ncbi:MAG: UDP-N-acetylglucosamine 1-carboxyvinyltransferase [Phycisphaeraceae bacterium]|nr:UDP-N-acetylglucosamine 1-carboxyvinyltransferase [Phycisphaeraceae bacterium]
MDFFRIQGGRRLSGRISVEGSKNAALPMMAASLLTDQPVVLRNVAELSDIANMARLLDELGVAVRFSEGAVTLHSQDENRITARYDVVRTMRASICTLGPMLARRRRAVVSMPGGCAFGDRPVDLHVKGMLALGAKVEQRNGNLVVSAERLKGGTVFLGGPNGSTVLGTANVMSAATIAKGRTIIECAACEPEIVDLARLLTRMGAKIQGAGSPRIIIDGVDELGGADYRVMSDRIVAGTYAVAAAMTNGDVIIDEFPMDALIAAVHYLGEIGVHVETKSENEDRTRCTVRVSSERTLRPAMITTQPHPGFPTDLQAQFMALLCLAQGNSIVTEKIYPERFLHVAELSRMGARLFRQGPTVMVAGGGELVGAPVMASDLRASASLVLAGLAARGETIVNRVYHLDRGYAQMEVVLRGLGADIERLSDSAHAPSADPAAEGASPAGGVLPLGAAQFMQHDR